MSFKNKVNQRRWYSWWHWGAVSQSWIKKKKKKIQPVKGSAVRDLWLCCSSEWSTMHPVLRQLFRWCTRTGRYGFPQQTSLPIYTSDSNEGWKREQTMALLYSNSLSFHPVMDGVARSRDRWLERQEESLSCCSGLGTASCWGDSCWEASGQQNGWCFSEGWA